MFGILHGRIVGHIDGLGDRARNEGLSRGHHADVGFDRKVTLADLAARGGAIENGQMLVLEERRAFKGHRTANMDVGGFDVLFGKAKEGQKLEGRVGELGVGDAERFKEISAQRPLVKDELDVEGRLHRSVERGDLVFGEALGGQRRRVDGGRLVHVAMTHGIGLDLGDLVFRIAQRAQGGGNGAVDDLEVAATGELLELDQREVRLDAGGVAIHDQTDGAGRGDDGNLGVAIAVLFTELEGCVPRGGRAVDQVLIGARGVVERNRRDREGFIAIGLAVRGVAVIADDAQHVLGVALVILERTELGGDFSGCRVGNAGHDGGEGTGDGTAFVAVIGDARGHEQAADVGVAKTEGAVEVGTLCNGL